MFFIWLGGPLYISQFALSAIRLIIIVSPTGIHPAFYLRGNTGKRLVHPYHRTASIMLAAGLSNFVKYNDSIGGTSFAPDRSAFLFKLNSFLHPLIGP